MCGAEDDTRGADAIQISGANSQCRGEQGEAETDCKGPVEKGWEACASGYSFTLCSQSVSAQLNTHLVPDTQMPVNDGMGPLIETGHSCKPLDSFPSLSVPALAGFFCEWFLFLSHIPGSIYAGCSCSSSSVFRCRGMSMAAFKFRFRSLRISSSHFMQFWKFRSTLHLPFPCLLYMALGRLSRL